MKNKTKYILKVYKYIFLQILYIAISIYLGNLLYKIIYDTTYNLKYVSLFSSIIDIFRFIRNIFGDYIFLIIYAILVILIYIMFSYKSTKNIASLMESVEIMADGNLDKRVDIKSNNEIGKIATNINKIVEKLKNITIEERKAQQTKTDLITNVSHDLRTPLTSIIGYLNLIEEDKYKDEVELRYYTNIAYEKSKDLNILINDLFELTKLQNKSLPLNKIDMNLVELLGQIISYIGYQVKQANMEIRTNFSNDRLIINADPDKLVRVLENLINNSTKYGNDGKYIDVVAKREDNNVVVEIINYGEEIPQVDIPFIFDRFYRIEKSRNRNDGGSGLGLAITKNIVEAHDGNILVSSDTSKTVFKVILPLDDK